MPKNKRFKKRKVYPEWTQLEDDFLHKYYFNEGLSRRIRKRLKYRTAHAIYKRVEKLGIKSGYWTLVQDKKLRRYYPKMGGKSPIKGKSREQVGARAYRLGLIVIGHRWTKEQTNILRSRYKDEGVCEDLMRDLNKNRIQILNRARREGLHISKECRSKIARKHNRIGEESSVYKGYKCLSGSYITSIRLGAKRRCLEFSIVDGSSRNMKYLHSIITENCPLSGLPLLFWKTVARRTEATASLDRIDYRLGYVKGNVRWVHKDINIMRKRFSDEEFILIANRIAKLHPRQIE